MSDPDSAEALDIARLLRSAGAAFGRRIVELAAGEELPFDSASWQDAIVFILAGELELQCTDSGHRFGLGDILFLTGLQVRTLYNHGPEPARLLAIWREAARR